MEAMIMARMTTIPKMISKFIILLILNVVKLDPKVCDSVSIYKKRIIKNINYQTNLSKCIESFLK